MMVEKKDFFQVQCIFVDMHIGSAPLHEHGHHCFPAGGQPQTCGTCFGSSSSFTLVCIDHHLIKENYRSQLDVPSKRRMRTQKKSFVRFLKMDEQ